jgi:hypothetical protein
VIACLSKLAIATDKVWKTDKAGTAAMMVYADKLVNFTADVVTKACDEWGGTHDRWPTLASLLKLCREHAPDDTLALQVVDSSKPENLSARVKRVTGKDAVEQVKQHKTLMSVFELHCRGMLSDRRLAETLEWPMLPDMAPPPAPPEQLRDEFIRLAEHVGFHLETECGHDRQAWQNVVGEGARMWERIRPCSGAEACFEADAGFVLEAWARRWLRVERLHVDYWNERKHTLYLTMTRGEPPELNGAFAPLPPWPQAGLSNDDQHILASWARNDLLAEKMTKGEGGPYFGVNDLLGVYTKMTDKRWTEQTRLARIYYGTDSKPWAEAITKPSAPIVNEPQPAKPARSRATDAEVRASARRLNRLLGKDQP